MADTGIMSGSVLFIDSNAVITNCTIANNLGNPVVALDSHVSIANCIVWDNGPTDLVATGEGVLSVSYSNVQRTSLPGAASDTEGPGNTQLPPHFVQQGRWTEGRWVPGDYHLLSELGRWDPSGQVWVQDQVTSPCIDAGDPSASVAFEPIPHGAIMNMGAYGGTSQASMKNAVENHTLSN